MCIHKLSYRYSEMRIRIRFMNKKLYIKLKNIELLIK